VITCLFLARCALNKDNIPDLLPHNLCYPTEKRIQMIDHFAWQTALQS